MSQSSMYRQRSVVVDFTGTIKEVEQMSKQEIVAHRRFVTEAQRYISQFKPELYIPVPTPPAVIAPPTITLLEVMMTLWL